MAVFQEMQKTTEQRVKGDLFVLLCLFLINLALFWPGVMTPDSGSQYQQALSGVYSDHHPPMMSFLWHYLAKIYPGPGLIYFLQLTLLYLSLFITLKTTSIFTNFKKRPVLLFLIFFIPWWPQILLYAMQIQKDNFFAFSFFLVAAILANFTLTERKIKWPVILVLIILIIYGSSVKYQAQFCAPILLTWLSFLLRRSNKLLPKVLMTILVIIGILSGIHVINKILVPESQKSYSWQYVKLYDLAAISIGSEEDLIPGFNKTKYYSFNALKQKFQASAVDPYIFPEDSILKKSSVPLERDQLWMAWARAVTKHPFLYLKHRARNFGYCLMSRVGFEFFQQFLTHVVDSKSVIFAIIYPIMGLLGYIFLSQFPVVILGIAYFMASIIYWRKSKVAPIIFGFTSIAMLMLVIIFFMSMAGTPRYIYVSVVMIHACHLFVMRMYQEARVSRLGCIS